MIARKPRFASSAAWPNLIQLVSASENRPCRSRIGRPSPISCQTRRAPSGAANSCLVGELANGLDPAFREGLVVFGPIFGQPFGRDPGAVHALDSEMMLGAVTRRIVERRNGEVHDLAVGKGEAERCAAFAAIGPPRDRRGDVPVRLALPFDVRLADVLERDRDASGGALAHPAMAEIG